MTQMPADEVDEDEDTEVMRANTRDGGHVTWVPMKPYLLGTPKLVAKIRTKLFMESRTGGIMVTPTGPLVEADPSNKLAVYAAINELSRHDVKWVNPPDITFGAPEDTVF